MIAGSYFAEESNEQNDEMAGDDQIQSNMMDDETAMKKAKQPTYEELFKMVQQQQ